MDRYLMFISHHMRESCIHTEELILSSGDRYPATFIGTARLERRHRLANCHLQVDSLDASATE